jgi:hypothetical protein
MTTQVAHSTIEHLMKVIPGQSVDWYIRVGQQIHEGKMPMPSIDGHAPPVEKVETCDRRLKNLLALCDDSKPKLNAVIDASCRRHPGKSMAWHLDQIETMLRPKVKAVTPQPAPARPPGKPNPETERQLLRMCGGDRSLAERLVDYERGRASGEEDAWQRAIDSLLRDRQQLYGKNLY